MSSVSPSDALERALDRIRPSVRKEHPYIVGGMTAPDVKLNQNESPFDLPAEAKAALFDAFLATPFNRYASEQPQRLVRALAARLGVAPESIVVGNGSNELTYTLGMCLIEPGTSVVLPRPMFALWSKVVHLFGGRLIETGCTEDYGFDLDALEAALRTHRPAFTVVTTPNNPTGRAVAFDDVRRLADVCAETGTILVVDEAYAEFTPNTPSATTLMETHPHVVSVRTFSKAMGLAGLRVGYLVGHPALTAELMKSRLPFAVDPLAETVALWCLDHAERIEVLAADLSSRTQALYDDVTGRGVETVPPTANFFLLRLPGRTGRHLQDAFAAEGVAVRTMDGYPELTGFVRVSCGTTSENRRFLEALDTIRSLV